MQKLFRKYVAYIITTASLVILIINFIVTVNSMQKQQLNTFNAKIDQIINTMEENQLSLNALNRALDEDYLTRARAAAYVIREKEGDLLNVSELQNLAKLLNVDEIHVIDENGIIQQSSVSKYIGLDFHDDEQTREFLFLLGDCSEDAYMIQEAMPNAAEGKIMKYVGVVRNDKKGIVQVGFEPIRQMEAQEKNTYDYIFSIFPTDAGEEFFAIDITTDQLIGHSGGMPENHSDDYHTQEWLKDCENGAYKRMENNETKYIVTRQYGDVLIGISIPKAMLFDKIWQNVLAVSFSLVIIEVVIIILLNYLVSRKVVNGIHQILKSLSDIANGNMDSKVEVGGNPEFEKLSSGINTMVKGIVNSTDRISKIIDISDIPLAAFEYQNDMKNVFITSGFCELLNLTAHEGEILCRNPELFYARIQEIMKAPVEGEKDIFQVGEQNYVSIRLSLEEAGYLGIITDVTEDILEKQQMQYDNNHDQLTGLFRYRYFKKLAGEKLVGMTSGCLCACVMMDLDKFKSINDTFGHDAGDEYLQQFAQALKELPKEHCITARRSGDEFCIFIYDCYSREEIINLLTSFWEMLKDRDVNLTSHQKRKIKASGGFACTDDPELDITLLLKWADEALYKAKREHKGRFIEFISE